MKIAVTGASGLFGHALARVFAERHDVVSFTHAQLEITDANAVREVLLAARANVILHSAAIPDLDACEADPPRAIAVNVEGTRHVVDAAREIGAGVVYISTDAVFDGLKTTPYVETDATDPPTVYGRTKLEGERVAESLPRHWIFRVSVLFGPRKTNFVEKCIRAIAAGKEYVAASDQMGSATYTLEAAQKILEVVEAGRQGLYHLSNEGACTRVELAQRATALAGLNPGKVVGVTSAQMKRRAKRLKYAVMDMAALRDAGFNVPRPWKEALAEYVGLLDVSVR